MVTHLILTFLSLIISLNGIFFIILLIILISLIFIHIYILACVFSLNINMCFIGVSCILFSISFFEFLGRQKVVVFFGTMDLWFRCYVRVSSLPARTIP